MASPQTSQRLDPSKIPWRATSHAGVFWYPFETPGGPDDNPADAVVLVRMDPDCGYPPHRHLGIEDVLVLQGGYRDELGEHRAGSHVRYAAGSCHAPVALGNPDEPSGEDAPACILFAIARGGVENH